ncbi:MAG: GNAT family N-acetyltransferase [Bacillota bacterium]
MTKRPESMMEGDINNRLNSKGHTFSLIMNGNIEGLAKLEKEKCEENSLLLSVRMRDMEWMVNNCHLIFKELMNRIEDFDVIRTRVFDFDEPAKKFFDLLGFKTECVMQKAVYKNNSYSSLLIYSIEKWQVEQSA